MNNDPFEAELLALEPSVFENLTYDALKSLDFKNLVWRTPGADGGRDIEGYTYAIDPTGHQVTQKWYIECKRYQASIDWPTVWKKISYADSGSADFFLLSTNTNPSPNCETEIAKWNSERRRPAIRVWRGYEWRRLLSAFPDVAISYGIGKLPEPHDAVRPITEALTKIVQAAYMAQTFDQDPASALEASAALSELVSKRLSELDRFGRFVEVHQPFAECEYSWLKRENGADCGAGELDDISLRAMLTYIRYISAAKEIIVEEVYPGRMKAICLEGRLAALNNSELEIIEKWSRLRVEFAPGEDRLEVIRYE